MSESDWHVLSVRCIIRAMLWQIRSRAKLDVAAISIQFSVLLMNWSADSLLSKCVSILSYSCKANNLVIWQNGATRSSARLIADGGNKGNLRIPSLLWWHKVISDWKPWEICIILHDIYQPFSFTLCSSCSTLDFVFILEKMHRSSLLLLNCVLVISFTQGSTSFNR